jgi:ribonucleoside-triphosphate reductase
VNFVQLDLPFQEEQKTAWGPSGKDVYERTYSRIKDDGSHETWPETVKRVVDGNISLVPNPRLLNGEREELIGLMEQFAIVPAGRHLWLSGVPGKQFINNCWVSGWTEKMSDHFSFTFDQLMQGGGVGANYSNINYPINYYIDVHLVLDPNHKDYLDCKQYLSDRYSPDSEAARTIGDTREDWVKALRTVIDAATHNGGGEIVFDLSTIRESGKRIKTFGGTSAGPVPLAKLLTGVKQFLYGGNTIDGIDAMSIDHLIAECVVSGNVRRSARMSVMHWLDPLILEFINLKSETQSHWSTNISVAIDSQFIEEVEVPGSFAKVVYDRVTEGMLKNGEPGFWNIELSNEDEPNWVECTNPCGEITLPAWGVCNLGHVNLDWFADKSDASLHRAHELMARFLIRATFADIPEEKARAVQDRDRRIGVGHFGFAGFVAKQGVRFSEAADEDTGHDIPFLLDELRWTVRGAADSYAYQLRIPTPVKVTTVAPTGTIAKMPGRSEGIHPIFAPYFLRRIRFSTVDPRQIEQLESYRAAGYDVEADLYSANTAVVTIPTKEPLVSELEDMGVDARILEGAYDLSLSAQLDIQKMYQKKYADNAVSFTVNLDSSRVDLQEFRQTLLKYLPDLKGTTVFPVLSRPQSPYEPISKADYEMYEYLGQQDTGYNEECATGACPVK